MIFSRNHYELLGVSPSADGETIRSAFRKLSKELHPDTTSLPKDEAAHRFQQVCEAYELLADPILRKGYDVSLAEMVSLREKLKKDSDFVIRNSLQTKNFVENRRPFSGGELFSLLLLVIAFLISVLIAIGFAVAQGRELMTRPSWLVASSSKINVTSTIAIDDLITTHQHTIKSTFFRSS